MDVVEHQQAEQRGMQNPMGPTKQGFCSTKDARTGVQHITGRLGELSNLGHRRWLMAVQCKQECSKTGTHTDQRKAAGSPKPAFCSGRI